ncbi:MAG: glycosyl hydrolase family 39 [Chitinophagales bacterium]
MKYKFKREKSWICLMGFMSIMIGQHLNAQIPMVAVNWGLITKVSRTTPTLQVVGNPMLRSSSNIHKGSFDALKSLGADYVRYVPWFPYPRLAVAELYPPTVEKTFWDFSLLDSMMNDFMSATAGHSVVINFSTIPVWMFKTKSTVLLPDDPNQVFWDYNQGLELRDSSLRELTDYYSRLFSWYTKGGFTDELGKYHESGHNYKISYWEVLNEPDLEHNISVRLYTRMYDAIVMALRQISPSTKFVGISLAFSNEPDWFNYFLDPKNHGPGIPLDAISYHFYASPSPNQTLEQYQYSFFDQAGGFSNKVKYIESIRRRLSPSTMTTINEIGSIINTDPEKIPGDYWNLSGALYAYIFLELTRIGIDVAGESQLVGFPTQFPDVSMIDWKNGRPNARYWVLKMIHDHFAPGDNIVSTHIEGNEDGILAQAFYTRSGRTILLANLRNREITLALPAASKGKSIELVDGSTGEGQPVTRKLEEASILLKPFAVAIVNM